MNKNLKIMIITLLVILSVITGYFIGNKDLNNDNDNQIFYATIEEINNNYMLVEGIEENDINYRTKYSFSIKNTTRLEWRGTKISLSDFKVGDRVSITFNGPVLDSYPGQLTNVIKIQLLNDKELGNNPSNEDLSEFEIIDETKECDTALELFYEDDEFKYYFNCIRSSTTFVKFSDGKKITIKEAVNDNILSIKDIEDKLKEIKNNSIMEKISK